MRLLRQKAAATSTGQETKTESCSAVSPVQQHTGAMDMLVALSAVLFPHRRQFFQPMFLPVFQPRAAAREPGNPKDTSSLLPAFVEVQRRNSVWGEWRDVACKATLHNTTF